MPERWPINFVASLPGEPTQDSTAGGASQDEGPAGKWLIDAIGKAGATNPDLGRWLSHLAIISVEIAA